MDAVDSHAEALGGVTGAAPRPGPEARIIALSMVKNEQDIIEPFVRHTLRFVDALFVIDHASVDATGAQLASLMRETGRVFVSRYDHAGNAQARSMTRLLRATQAVFRAHYICMLDADEFIEADSPAAFRRALGAIPPGGYGLVPARNFVVPPQVRGAPDPPYAIRRAMRPTGAERHKAILRLDGRQRRDIDVAQGNHFFYSEWAELPCVELTGVRLAHFPVRGADQIAAKAVFGWMGYLIRDPATRDPVMGRHRREVFDRVLDNPMPCAATVASMALNYDQPAFLDDFAAATMAATPPARMVRRYSTGLAMPALACVARSWQTSVLAGAGAGAEAGATGEARDAAEATLDLPPLRLMLERYAPPALTLTGSAATTLYADDAAASGVAPGDGGLALCVPGPGDDADPEGLVRETAARARVVLFAAHGPGRPDGHATERAVGAWLALWAEAGFGAAALETLAARAAAALPWFRSGLYVLRAGVRTDRATRAALNRGPSGDPAAWPSVPPVTHRQMIATELEP